MLRAAIWSRCGQEGWWAGFHYVTSEEFLIVGVTSGLAALSRWFITALYKHIQC